jgi:hypothetical protein
MRPLAYSPLTLVFVATLIFVATLVIGAPAQPSAGCFVSPDKSQELSLQIAPGEKRAIYTAYYKQEGGEGSCSATIQVSLSSFPSSRLATRPKDVAVAVREVLDLWEIDNCTVQVWYDNDTGEEFAEHELCLSEDFRFDNGAYWSASAERYCWEPSDFEFDEAVEDDSDIDTEIEEIVEDDPDEKFDPVLDINMDVDIEIEEVA